jgi:DNA-binding transcriptional ArsR family regulator
MPVNEPAARRDPVPAAPTPSDMAMRHRSTLDDEIFERQAVICKAFAHPTRLHLLQLLGNGPCTMADLQDVLAISKANLSQHVAVLRGARVVATHREGKHVVCSLAMPEVKHACSLIHQVLKRQLRQSRKLL